MTNSPTWKDNQYLSSRFKGERRVTTAAETEPEGPLPVFEAGEWAVHPGHGVGRVASIEERSFGGQPSVVYVLEILGSELKVMVPKVAAARVGLRPVMSTEQAEEIFTVLATQEVAVTTQPWNRRFRAYTEMISSGLPTEVAKVMRDMSRLRFEKDLSFGERRLLEQAEQLLRQELALALSTPVEEVDTRIAAIFRPASVSSVD